MKLEKKISKDRICDGCYFLDNMSNCTAVGRIEYSCTDEAYDYIFVKKNIKEILLLL